MISAKSQLDRLQNHQEMNLLAFVFGNIVIMIIDVERHMLIVGTAFPGQDSMKQRSELRTSMRALILLGFLMCSCCLGFPATMD